jgi:hypothetical protein
MQTKWLDKLERKHKRDDLMKQVAEGYRDGESLDALVTRFNLPSRNFVHKCLAKHGIQIRPRSYKNTFGQKKDDDTSDREMIKEIAKMLGGKHYRMECL